MIILILLYFLRSGFLFSLLMSAADASELPASMFNKALHLTPFTSTTTTGYCARPPPIASISWFESLSQIELLRFPLPLLQVVVHPCSTDLCLVPVQLKHTFLSDKYLLLSAPPLILSQSTDLCSVDLQ